MRLADVVGCLVLGACAADAPDARPTPTAETAAPAVNARFQESVEIIQLVIDAKELEPYWHVDERPERAPLEIEVTSDPVTFAASRAAPAPVLTKFGQPVVVKNAPAGPSDRAWELRLGLHVEIRGDAAEVTIRYPVEGLHGAAKLLKEAGRWRVLEVSISER